MKISTLLIPALLCAGTAIADDDCQSPQPHEDYLQQFVSR